jgi:hypothetical protein
MSLAINEIPVATAADHIELSEFLLARLAEEEAIARSCLDEDTGASPVLRRVMEGAVTACVSRRRLVLEHRDSHPHEDDCELLVHLAAAYLSDLD